MEPLPGLRDPPWCWASYAVSCLLTGLAFCVLGANYWGRFYAFGIGFFVLATIIPWTLTWASLEFGLLWTAALVVIALRLRRLAREAAVEPPGRPSGLSLSDSDKNPQAPLLETPLPGR
jgi:hypothetical protein